MSKTTKVNNSKVKRRLLDELNKESDGEIPKKRATRNEQPLPREDNNQGGKPSSTKIGKNNKLVVEMVTRYDKNNLRRVKDLTARSSANNNAVPSKTTSESRSNSGIGSKRSKNLAVQIPVVKSSQNNKDLDKQTRSRIIKKPARFLMDQGFVANKSKSKGTNKIKHKLTNPPVKTTKFVNLAELDIIDSHSMNEIVDGNVAGGAVEHDGVELSINGSDIDEFSDEEGFDEAANMEGEEPGEIVSSGDEAEASVSASIPVVVRQKITQKTSAARGNHGKHDNRVVIDKSKAGQQNTVGSKFQHLRDDPEFNSFLDQMLDKKLSDTGNYKKNGQKGNNNGGKQNLIKSPSDTTLYTPGLRKANEIIHTDQNVIEKISHFVDSVRISSGGASRDTTSKDRRSDKNSTNHDEPEHVSKKHRNFGHDVEIGECSTARTDRSDETDMDTDDRRTQHTTDQLLLQAEKFKARVEAPKGMNSNSSLLMPYDYDKLRSRFITDEGLAPIDREILFLRNFDQDDEFFHVTSQIDPNLKSKIERGEFVDLERLLPKDKFSSGLRGSADELNKQLFQLISQGTNSYLTPPESRSGNKINNVRKWDQAFRVYAAIYTQANPNRSGEIWQYVYIIHTAASSNPWENVAFYDVTFRELMACKPWRSWGKTYSQGWNMAFNNGNAGFNHGGGAGSSFGNGRVNGNQNGHNSHNNNSNQNNHSWKDDCCWRFNKNRCKRTSNECRYDHRCTHCAGWYHSYNDCKKRNNRGAKSNNWSNFNNNTKAKPSPAKTEKK